MTPLTWTRRRALSTGAGIALAGTLTACGGDDEEQSTPQPPPSEDGDPTLAEVADVPVGGAVAATTAEGRPVLVTQPTEGTFVAFSAICTHRGCTVAPADGDLRCPCHGSTYDLATGEVTGGPAPAPLPEVAVRVRDGQVLEG